MYRFNKGELQVLLVHPGGPFWQNKDEGAWFVPKGEINVGEQDFEAAQREFTEETGIVAKGDFIQLGEVTHKSGKRVVAWAFEGDCEPGSICSNTFEMEWPPRSGKRMQFPEVDRAEFYETAAAKNKMIAAEFEFVMRLQGILRESGEAKITAAINPDQNSTGAKSL